MANDTTITVRGWVGSEPRLYAGSHDDDDNRASVSTAVMSLGVTPRLFNRRTNRFEDGQTAWYSIRCFGPLAQNVARSVHKGAPVLVRGRLNTRTYIDKNDVQRVSQVIYADSVAIDLNSSIATYTKSRPGYVLNRGDERDRMWEHPSMQESTSRGETTDDAYSDASGTTRAPADDSTEGTNDVTIDPAGVLAAV
ncbi:MAG: single-stranded DNA-binding protein [Actinomycetaceae bacterium]|nr:single-stranded DNA-binding protein [Arcanobacterium sp.]MDD7504964.1 single-stranded DNA-binding protein [Actinomycetaceae bacterium]MDY6143715.1 single-stranded DNA-binding protein [Arcanobacterium sp.]